MQPKLPRLIRELKNEKCPQRVRDEVRGRIAARESSAPRLRFAMPIAISCLILACSLVVWRWNIFQNAREQARLAELNVREERAHVASQTEDALNLVGSVLLKASAHSEKIISDRTVPQLRNSYEIAKNKIAQHIDL